MAVVLVVMGIHKLSAGDGYTYLTRHVAGGDVDRVRGQDAADYYTAEGNPPGRWVGNGLAALGLAPGDSVSEEQMRALYGLGIHPDAETIITAYQTAHLRPGMSEDQVEQVNADARAAASLGRAFNQYAALEPFADRVAARLTAIDEQTGRAPTPVEVSKVKAEEARRSRHAVAGYDLVFTPVKSVSVLWGLHPDPTVRAAVRAAHEHAVTSAMAMLEEHAAFTRTGHNGVAQVDTNGLVAVAFDHYDSRAGDPNLHTHLVLSNKIQGKDGKWRALDGRPLHHLTVAVSEHYNTTLQAALTQSLGVKWVARWTERGVRRGEPVWELDAIPTAWVEHYSSRRTAITARYDELVTEYRARHGHDPYAKAAHDLARQATLETRQGKKEPRSLEATRRTWVEDLTAVFGPDAVEELMQTVAGTRPRQPEPVHRAAGRVVASATVGELAERVVQAVAGHRSTWTVWNVHAETERLLRDPAITSRLAADLGTGSALSPEQTTDLVAAVVAAATGPRFSISTDPPPVLDEPAVLRRADGHSVFDEHAAARYTSQAVLDAEDRLLNAARTIPTRPQPRTDRGRSGTNWGRWWERPRQPEPSAPPSAPGAPTDPQVHVGQGPRAEQVAATLNGFEDATGTTLDEGQRALVTAFTADPRLLVAGIGPGGSGKTTAMRAYLHTLTALTAGARLLPLATSSRSAAVLAGELAVPAENLHKFLYEHTRGPHAKHLSAGRDLDRLPDAARQYALRAGDVVLLDEAGMAGTFNLDALVQIATTHGAYVRLLGDPAQLSAVESGGALRLIASEVGAAELTTLHRFENADEAAATLKVRVGDSSGLDFYATHTRIVGGSKSAMIESAYTGWLADVHAGKTSFLPAGTNADVATLSARARSDRVTAGHVEPEGVQLHDGNLAGRGDWIITRRVNRRLALNGGKDFVRNGDGWTVLERHPDGGLVVEHLGHHGRTTLPPGYVTANVELLYATTAHRVQGGTVQTAHPLITDNLTREQLYVMLTRAMECTTLHVGTHDVLPLDEDERLNKARRDPDHRAALEVLHTILSADTAERSATETIRTAQDAAGNLSRLIPRYLHALPVLTPDLTRAGHSRDDVDAVAGPVASRFQYADLLGQALGARLADHAVREPAWAALQAALTRAQESGLDPAAVLGQVVNRRDLTDRPHLSESLAGRIHRHLAADKNQPVAEGSEAPGVLGLAPRVSFRLPWVPPAPPDAHPYLPAAARLIEDRVIRLAVKTVAEQPPWSHALGQCPDDDTARQEWVRQAGIVAAYREQYEITDNDPARPLGAYQEPGQDARPAYWDAAAAITTARQLAQPTRPDTTLEAVYRISDTAAGRSEQQAADHRARTAARNRAIAHEIAVDTYLALPQEERARIVTSMITRRGNLWYGPTPDREPGTDPATDTALPVVGLDEAAVQEAHAPQLHRALIERGHLAAPVQHRAFGLGSPAHRPGLEHGLRTSRRPMPPPMTPPRPGPSLGL